MNKEDINGQVYEAPDFLQEVLSHFYHLSAPPDATTVVKHLSPNYDMLLLFNLGPCIHISFHKAAPAIPIVHTAVIGPLKKMLNYEVLPGTDVIIINFTLNGFYRLFGLSMQTFTGEEVINPDSLVSGSPFAVLWQQLLDLTDPLARIQLLTTWIASRIQDNEPASKPLLDSLRYFEDATIQPVKAIAADTQLSERTIQLRFQKYTGYTPKEMLRFLRFKEVVYHMVEQEGEKVDLFDLVATYGYHDQSHLIKDFQHFAGTTPLQFKKIIGDNQFCVSYKGKYY